VIASVRGPVLAADGERAVVAVGGLGLEIMAAGPTLSALSRQVGEEVQLQTYLHVREDALQLFGFRSLRERAFFLALIGVSGVGPKVALAVLSGYPVGELETAVALDDVKKFESIPGIGKRLAQRLVIELKDKVGAPPLAASDEGAGGALPADVALQARSALQNLGLSLREAEEALKGAPADADLQDLIKHALAQKSAG
jgi:Holliday junction DNA helicase RuvA